MFLHYYLLLLNKTYNNQNQEGFIINSLWRCSVKKGVLKNFENFTEKNHLCWFLLLIKLQAFRPLCKYCCALAIVKNVYTNEADLFFCFAFISSIESDENLPTCFFKIFFHIFYNLFAHFLVERFCIRQNHLMLGCF